LHRERRPDSERPDRLESYAIVTLIQQRCCKGTGGLERLRNEAEEPGWSER
jgi:hypothetical protein